MMRIDGTRSLPDTAAQIARGLGIPTRRPLPAVRSGRRIR